MVAWVGMKGLTRVACCSPFRAPLVQCPDTLVMLTVACLANNPTAGRLPILSQGTTTYNSFYDHARNAQNGNTLQINPGSHFLHAKPGCFPLSLPFQQLHDIISPNFFLLIQTRSQHMLDPDETLDLLQDLCVCDVRNLFSKQVEDARNAVRGMIGHSGR